MTANGVLHVDGSGGITSRGDEILRCALSLQGSKMRRHRRRRGRGSGDLCCVPSAKRGVGRRPLRKALEVIEAHCSDDISSPPRCRPIPRSPPSPKYDRYDPESRVKSDFGSTLRAHSARGDVSIVRLYVRMSVCVYVRVINVCARERLHRVWSIESSVAHSGRLLLRNYVISRISLSPNRLRI